MVINEDRKVIAAVHKERERIAHGVEIITQALKKGDASSSSAPAPADGSASSKRPRCRRPSALAQPWCRRSWPAARRRCSRPRKGSKTTTRKAPAASPPPAHEEGRRHRRFGQRHDAVRPRRPHARAQSRARRSSSSPAGPDPSCRTSSTCRSRRRSAPRSSPARPGSRPARPPRWCSTC